MILGEVCLYCNVAYNEAVRIAREEGLTMNPSSRATYTPLIDMKPPDRDTMLKAMLEAERLRQLAGGTGHRRVDV